MKTTSKPQNISIENIYRLDGRVPIAKAVPFGLQHILAMFVSNLAPITIIAGAAGLDTSSLAVLLQNAMFIAGIATLIQLYPVWRVGSRLPVVMGVSFTFVAVLSTVASNYGYPSVIGAVIVGGLMEGTLGLLANYWRRLITPIVAASVVTAIGFSLFTVGTRSFGGGYVEDFGSAQNLLLGLFTLIVCLVWNALAKGYLKQLNVLAGLLAGYAAAVLMGKVDLSTLLSGGLIALPGRCPICRSSTWARSSLSASSSSSLRRKPLAIPPRWSPEDWTGRLPAVKFPAPWPATATPPVSPACLAARPLPASPRMWALSP